MTRILSLRGAPATKQSPLEQKGIATASTRGGASSAFGLLAMTDSGVVSHRVALCAMDKLAMTTLQQPYGPLQGALTARLRCVILFMGKRKGICPECHGDPRKASHAVGPGVMSAEGGHLPTQMPPAGGSTREGGSSESIRMVKLDRLERITFDKEVEPCAVS